MIFTDLDKESGSGEWWQRLHLSRHLDAIEPVGQKGRQPPEGRLKHDPKTFSYSVYRIELRSGVPNW